MAVVVCKIEVGLRYRHARKREEHTNNIHTLHAKTHLLCGMNAKTTIMYDEETIPVHRW